VKSDKVASTSLAVRHEVQAAKNVWDDVRLQKFWLAIDRHRWQSLSVIAASAAVDTYALAELLAQLAWRYHGQPSNVFDLRDLSMRLVDYELREMRAQIASGTRLVVALRSIFENPTAAPVAKQTDAALICIVLGKTTLKDVRETTAAVGRDAVIGSVVLRPPRRKRSARTSP